jgi:aryl-alcohol dehydrogenase-like predicted oxidoreductase
MRALTYALTDEDTALAALEALRNSTEPAAIEALIELLARSHRAPLTPAAVHVLDTCQHPLVDETLVDALDSPLVPVRQAAIDALWRRQVFRSTERLDRLLREDPSWRVRRTAVHALAAHPLPDRWRILVAADDPHWRVRHALLQVLRDDEEGSTRLEQLPPHPRTEGLRDYLAACRTGDWSPPRCISFRDALNSPSWWDDDPAVLVRNLEQAGESRDPRDMVRLLGHDDERVRRLAIVTLRRKGSTAEIVAALCWLDDPRMGAAESVAALLAGLDMDRVEEAARFIFHGSEISPFQLAWAIDQVGVGIPLDEENAVWLALFEELSRQPACIRCALTRLAGRWPGDESERWLRRLLDDPKPEVRAEALAVLYQRGRLDETTLARLRDSAHTRERLLVARVLVGESGLESDPHPLVRAAALTPSRARELLDHPERETSWHVLACAARLCRVPFWQLEPRPRWQPSAEQPRPADDRRIVPRSVANQSARVALGPARLLVSRIGISGHYGLPVEGFARAVEAGVNLFFWEPNYQTLAAFAAQLCSSGRQTVHFLAGTFEATPRRVRKDVERALRILQIERIAIFLIFWVRSWTRITDDMRRLLDDLRDEGKVLMPGLSTHSRTLAVEAINGGWDPVMVRHSAGHRGAEQHIFPLASQLGRGLITFNNLCYGRLLRPRGNHVPPSAADCYRYSLSQPGVAVSMSAPATFEQLQKNLEVMRDPHLPDERRQALLAYGADLYQDEVLFRQLIRSR